MVSVMLYESKEDIMDTEDFNKNNFFLNRLIRFHFMFLFFTFFSSLFFFFLVLFHFIFPVFYLLALILYSSHKNSFFFFLFDLFNRLYLSGRQDKFATITKGFPVNCAGYSDGRTHLDTVIVKLVIAAI